MSNEIVPMNLQIIYDGPLLQNHEIDPKELSTALLGLDTLLNEANRILNNDKAEIKLRVKASFETGCFKINFSVSQDFLNKAVDLLSGKEATAISNASGIISLIFLGGGSLLALLKFLKGFRPDKLFESSNGNFIVEKDGRSLEVEKKVIEIYKNFKLRQSFEKLISPIEKEGIDDFGIKVEKGEFVHIKKEEFSYFKVNPSQEKKLDSPAVFTTNITIISLSFKEGNKWYVNDGESSFYATVEDKSFLKKIDDNLVQFGKGDVLKVRVRKEQFYLESEAKLKAEQYIEKVEEHKKPSQMEYLF